MEAIASIRSQHGPPAEVILVDDGSAEEVTRQLRTKLRPHSDVRLIRTRAPVGACAARNLGAREATGEWLVFLDDDVVFADRHGLAAMKSVATVHPEDRDIIEKAVAEKRSINFDHRIIRPDGQERIVHEQGEIVVDKTREMIRIFGTVLDITERKRAEEALAQERHLLNHFIENIPDAIYFKDQEGHFLRVNKTQAARLHLNDPEEALGKTDFDFFSDEDARLAYEEELRVMQTGQISINERKKVYPNGKECWVQTTKVPMFDEEGKMMGVFGLTRDTTARKNVEEALRRVHTETEQLLAAISSILIGVGADNRITRWNATAESAFGIKSSKILGKPFQKSGIHWDWNMIMQSISESLDKMQPMRLDDIRYLRADGKDGFLGLTITPIVSDAHEKKGFLILAADITERKTLECQLAQAQKLESIGQLAAGIAHEINTPTQYVGDNARFLQVAFGRLKNVLHINHELLKAAKENAITKELIAEADSIVEDTKMTYIVDEIPIAIQETLDGVDRVANIVRAMKEYAHPDADEMTLTDINKALENTITVACNEWKYVAEMVTEFDPSLPLVPCLPGKLNQVFLNLIVNAVHAISDVVGDGSAGKGIIKVSTGYERDWVEIKISDSGTGIPEEFRPKIFDPFFTSKEVGKGTGQGLSISHNVIVEKHGGSITFETEIGKGTTFIIRLPINSTNHLIETSNEKTNPVCR
ncbi:MAG: PAS domain S-box protein [bacterium]